MKLKLIAPYFVAALFLVLCVYQIGQRDKYQFAYELSREFDQFVIKNSMKHNVGLVCTQPKSSRWPGTTSDK